MSTYNKLQALNDWAKMLNELYGSTQNYSRSTYELHTHLTEVTGVVGKYLLKRKSPDAALEFLPKVFAWTLALVSKMEPHTPPEEMVLRKFPGVCPYCRSKPCACWKTGKSSLDEEILRKIYFSSALAQKRSVDDFQLMFRSIYEDSWTAEEPNDLLRMIHTRLVEELAEIAEAIRFHHLYPSNFNNEIADFIAWWFAMVSTIHRLQDKPMVLASDLLWAAYPAFCRICESSPCFCRPSPVRILMSKPLPGQLEYIDGLTSLFNQRAYGDHIQQVKNQSFPLATPAACIRIDLDNFKNVNDTFGHNAGDEVLKYVASILRKKGRERDKVYRPGGDEFAMLCSDFSTAEAAGMMERVAQEIKSNPVSMADADGKNIVIPVTLSIGVSECSAASQIEDAFEKADEAAYESKAAGRDRITVHQSVGKPKTD